MPLKWKIFKAINIINWVLIFPMLVILAVYYTRRLTEVGPEIFHIIFFLFLLAMVLLLVNSIYHFSKTRSSLILNELQVNFNATGSKLLFILCLLSILGLTAFFIFGVNEEFFTDDVYRSRDNTGKYVLLYLLVVIGINTYIAVLQIQLLKMLVSAKKETLSQVIDSIGTPGE
jgi:hypothetical protein